MIELYYLDASAWAKRYLGETGSSEMSMIFDSGKIVAGTMLGYIEVVSAIYRRSTKDIADQFLELLEVDRRSMLQIELSPELLALSAELPRKHRLRGADAIHLASVLHLQRTSNALPHEIAMVAADRELLHAAEASSITCINPETRE